MGEPAFRRTEELPSHPWALGEARDVHRARDSHADHLGLWHRRGQAAEAAPRSQLAPEAAGALGEDADAGARTQLLHGPVEGVLVALPALDRDLAHAVEHPAEPADLPQRRLGES